MTDQSTSSDVLLGLAIGMWIGLVLLVAWLAAGMPGL